MKNSNLNLPAVVVACVVVVAVNVVGFGVLVVVGASVIACVVSLGAVNVVVGVGDFDVVFG